MNKDCEKVFRQFEQELDTYYQMLPLWQRPRGQALYATLAVPDGLFLVNNFLPEPPTDEDSACRIQSHKSIQEGFSQALKWLYDGSHPEPVQDRNLIDEAGFFHSFASRYVDIADFHRMVGRKQADVIIDAEQCVVKFDILPGNGFASTDYWREETARRKNSVSAVSSKDLRNAEKILRSLRNQLPHRLENGRIVVPAIPSDLVPQLAPFYQSQLECELCPLASKADLLGFTMEQYAAFYAVIATWSIACVVLYHKLVTDGAPQETCMPTQVVTRKHFIEQVGYLSSLPQSTVNDILCRLTLKPAPSADICLTPFIANDDQVAWSPGMVIQYRSQRNMLKVMSRGAAKYKVAADTLIGSRDRPLANLVGQRLAREGYQFKLETFVSANGESTDIDLLAYHTKKPEEVLLVEVKALLAPDEINEVDNATAKLKYGQKQLKKGIRILHALPVARKQSLFKFVDWKQVRHLAPIVVASDAEPAHLLDPREIPAISLNTMLVRLKRRDLKTPRRIWEACRDRPWLEIAVEEGVHTHGEIRVGSLRYLLPTVAFEELPVPYAAF